MCNSFYYLRGGVERCFFGLMDLHAMHGHENIPFCMRHERNLPTPYEKYFLDAIDFPALMQRSTSLKMKFQVAERVLYFKEAQKYMERLILDTHPEIAHIQQIDHEISPSIIPIIKNHNIPVVQTLHDYKPVCPNTNFYSHGAICELCAGKHFFYATAKRCKRGALMPSMLASAEAYYQKYSGIYEKNVDLFIVPSRFLQKKLMKYGFKGRMVHLPNFVDLNVFTPGKEKSEYFVYFGRLVELKGIRTLLKALKHVKTTRTLYVIGEGELEDPLKDFARENKIKNVEFMGFMQTQDLIPFIQKAMFTVFPSECYENYPMSIIESNACATPVVGSDLGGISELIDHGKTGLLFQSGNHLDLAEKIQFLVDHPEKAYEMGNNGRQLVERTNHPQVYHEKIMQLYHDLLDKNHGQAENNTQSKEKHE